MNRGACLRLAWTFVLCAHLFLVGGCTTLEQWVRNGFKVGPNFHGPDARRADEWSDRDEFRFARGPMKDDAWWNNFHDPVLESLIESARQQNLDLKSAVARVLQAQAQRNISAGNLLP